MSWKNPRPSDIRDPVLRQVIQSLERFLAYPTFERGLLIGDGTIVGDDPDDGTPGTVDLSTLVDLLDALETLIEGLNATDVAIDADLIPLLDADTREADLEAMLTSMGHGDPSTAAAYYSSAISSLVGDPTLDNVSQALEAMGSLAAFVLSSVGVLSDAHTDLTAIFLDHSARHESGGDDELALDASQITTGTIDSARLPTTGVSPAHPAVFGPGYVSPSGNAIQTYPQFIAETVPSWSNITNQSVLTSGRLALVGIWLPEDTEVTSISFLSGTTAAGTPTNQWFGLFDDERNALRLTADDTTTAWSSLTLKTLALTSSYTTTYSGLHFLGVMVAASTVPSLRAVAIGSGITPQAFNTNTGLTTPPSLPYQPATTAALASAPYARVS